MFSIIVSKEKKMKRNEANKYVVELGKNLVISWSALLFWVIQSILESPHTSRGRTFFRRWSARVAEFHLLSLMHKALRPARNERNAPVRSAL